MKISLNRLDTYIKVPASLPDLIDLFEDTGLEVKRTDNLDSDTVLTLELLANRGDHHSYTGIARELHGRTAWPMVQVPFSDIKIAPFDNVRIGTEYCLAYYTLSMGLPNAAREGTPPSHVESMLEIAGAKRSCPVVDVTNFVALEIGQPLHAYDADKIVGQICVREAIDGEQAWPLFSDGPVYLPRGTLVVADDIKVLAIAGVIGCEESKVTSLTRNIVLESATFDPVRVRLSARRLGIVTSASTRFERGGDLDLPPLGIRRAHYLLSDLGWVSAPVMEAAKEAHIETPDICLTKERIERFFGTVIDSEKAFAALERYGFSVKKEGDQINFAIPSWRHWDVHEPCDILEEIAKAEGYNSFPAADLSITHPVVADRDQQAKLAIENVLTGRGFYEVFTDGFYSEKHRARLNVNPGDSLWEHIHILDARDRSFSLLKNNNIAQAVELVGLNTRLKNERIRAYEWSRVFRVNTEACNGSPEEVDTLWFIATGTQTEKSWMGSAAPADVFYLKGILEEIGVGIGQKWTFSQSEEVADRFPDFLCLHPRRRAYVISAGTPIGIFGEVHPAVMDAWDMNGQRSYFAQIITDYVREPQRTRVHQPQPSVHPVQRSVCLLLPNGLASMSVAQKFREASKLIHDISISEGFRSETTNQQNAVTFVLHFDSETLNRDRATVDEINEITERAVVAVIDAFAPTEILRR